MLIVVEGVDGAGKTTLIDSLASHSKRPFWRIQGLNPYRDSAPLESFLRWLKTIPPHVDIVCDRIPLISEPIYGTILRSFDRMEYLGAKEIDEFFQLPHLRIIYCRPSRYKLIDSVQKNPQLAGVVEHLDALLNQYDLRMACLTRTYGIHIRTHDFTVPVKSFDDFFFGGNGQS